MCRLGTLDGYWSGLEGFGTHFGPPNPKKRTRFCPTLTFPVNFHVKFWSPKFKFLLQNHLEIDYFDLLSSQSISGPSPITLKRFQSIEFKFWTVFSEKMLLFFTFSSKIFTFFVKFGPPKGLQTWKNPKRRVDGPSRHIPEQFLNHLGPQKTQKRTRFHFSSQISSQIFQIHSESEYFDF